MPKNSYIALKELQLDLGNYRTIPQIDPTSAVNAMVSVKPEWFWALMDSLLQVGYLPTENIIVLKNEKGNLVKEGNRRIGALKIIFGEISLSHGQIPSHIDAAIQTVSPEWKEQNSSVPCLVYDEHESAMVDHIITLMHGKGQLAGRDAWNPVARARHNRDKNGASEPTLDLLEKYLKEGQNRTPEQAQRWAGVYPLSVLEEAIRRLVSRIGYASARELSEQYPNLGKHRFAVESVVRDVGLELLTFPIIRNNAEDFASTRYDIPVVLAKSDSQPVNSIVENKQTGAQTTPLPRQGDVRETTVSPTLMVQVPTSRKRKAYPNTDPRSVISALKKFSPRGNGREKLVALLNEARALKINIHKHCFCFVLRSMFELSAKAYCEDHKNNGGPTAIKPDGTDQNLVELLKKVETHLIDGNKNKAMVKRLHGAITELAEPSGLFSITSLNHLIHHPSFSIAEDNICTMFWRVFPLLEEMNR